jgi:hypothetical protein
MPWLNVPCVHVSDSFACAAAAALSLSFTAQLHCCALHALAETCLACMPCEVRGSFRCSSCCLAVFGPQTVHALLTSYCSHDAMVAAQPRLCTPNCLQVYDASMALYLCCSKTLQLLPTHWHVLYMGPAVWALPTCWSRVRTVVGWSGSYRKVVWAMPAVVSCMRNA